MSTSPRHPRVGRRSRRATAALVGVALLLAACADGDDDDAGASVPTPTSGAPTSADASSPVMSAGPASEPTTSPSESSEPPEPSTAPTSAGTVAPTTEAPTTTAAPTTTTSTVPLSVQELILRPEGLGSARFGADPEGVIAYVTSILGGNTGDTGWGDPFAFAVCNGTEARKVDWGVLSLHFTDLSRFGNGRRHFVGYEYGLVGQIGDEPVGLRTPGAVTLGSRVVDLLAEFPEASVNAGLDDSFPDNFYVSDVFWGLLTGTDQDDVVTVFFGGEPCGG